MADEKVYKVQRGVLLFMAGMVLVACSQFGCTSQNATQATTSAYSRSSSGELFMKMQSGEYTIKEGDKIDLSVWDYPEFKTSSTVNQMGTITIPLVGDIQAAGMSKDEFIDQLKKKLAEYVKGEPKITLSISSPMTQKITVIGAVTKQDNYPVTSQVSLLEILSAAGGTTADADLYHIKIIRFESGGDPDVVDLADAMETGKVETLPKVRPGDTVYVPEKENVVRSLSVFLSDAILLLGIFRVLY